MRLWICVRRALWRLTVVSFLTIVSSWASLPLATAQEGEPAPAPDVSGQLTAMVVAFQAVADASTSGDWQGADSAFNGALDAMDLHATTVADAIGDPARAGLARVDGLVVQLVAALDAEDQARVRATVALIHQELQALSPSGAGSAPATSETQAVLRWQDSLRQIEVLGELRQWRDMRNAAMALTDIVVREGPDVVVAAGPESQRSVDTIRVFAMRLIAAAQNQSHTSAESSVARANEALVDLLVALGAMASPASDSSEDVRMRFRAHHIAGDPGDVVVVPVAADDVPRIGLGSFDLELGWSPVALRLVDASWTMAPGTAHRDDAAGKVRLSMPPAPTGPSGNVDLLGLKFEVLPERARAIDYLPVNDVRGLETAIADARRLVREGDVPNAASEIERVYLSFVGGAGEPGSLYDRLSRYELATPLAASMLFALDVTSRPAEADVILLALEELDSRTSGTVDAFLRAVGGDRGVPITIDVLDTTDTTGATLETIDPEPGLVIRSGSLLPTGAGQATGDGSERAGSTGTGGPPAQGQGDDRAAGAATGEAVAADVDRGFGAEGGEDGAGEVSAGQPTGDVDSERLGSGPDSERPFPVALVVALLVAVGAGLAVLVMSSGSDDEDDSALEQSEWEASEGKPEPPETGDSDG